MGSREFIELTIQWIRSFLGPFVLAFTVFLVLYFVIKYIAYLIKKRVIQDHIDNDLYAKKVASLVGSVVVYIGMAFNVLIAFEIMGLDVGILMAGVSFGIGFAMQQILENMFAGFLIISNPMLKVGETIVLQGEYGNTYGQIEKLASRYTVIRKVNGRKLIIPNTKFNKTPIQTYMREEMVRGEVLFTVEHHIAIETLQALMIEAVNAHPMVQQKEKTSVISSLVDGTGTTYKVYFFIDPKNGLPLFKIASDIRVIVMNTLNAHHITVPYPKQVLDFAPDTELLAS